MESNDIMLYSNIRGLPPPRRGKVRDIYDLGDRLLLVATDRISAFDSVFPTAVPDKGRILTSLSLFWLRRLEHIIPNHLVDDSLSGLNLDPADRKSLEGRAVVVKKAAVAPFECIVRGYLIGSGWKEYRATGKVSGIKLPPGLRLAEKLPEPIFTPSTKAEAGHDENVSFEAMAETLGFDAAAGLRDASLRLYSEAAAYAHERGVIIADTKFEFGFADGGMMLVDEALTPDSSRFWPRDSWKPGVNPPSFDKQYLRDWLERESGWNMEPPAPELPEAVVAATRRRYLEAHELLTGRPLPERGRHGEG